MATFFMVAAVVVGIIGCITVYKMARPLMKMSSDDSEQMVIPLAEIAPVWIIHNKEIVPVKISQSDDAPGDALDSLFAEAKGKYAKENEAVAAQPETQEKPEKPAEKDDGSRPPWAACDPVPVVTTTQPKVEEPSAAGIAPAPAVTVAPAVPVVPPAVPPPVVAAAQPAPATLDKNKLQQEFNSLWQDCIEPHMKSLVDTGADKVINSLLRLLETHGHCPSIVIGSNDGESVDLISVRDNLAKVTLKEHTYAVCRIMLGLVKEHFATGVDLVIPNALIISLGHDIGKIPELRLSGAYNSEDHAFVSGDKVAELMESSNISWKDRTIPVIKRHHTTEGKDDLSYLLKKADQTARQMELISISKNYSIKPFKEWFNVRKYLTEYIAPEVNTLSGKGWNAFSFKGTIYAKPYWLYDKAKIMCGAEKILDLTFKYESQKDDALRSIINALREQDLTPLLGDNFQSRPFEIRTSVENTKGKPQHPYLSAITIPDYIDQVQMEARKTSGYPQIINAVIPQNPKNNQAQGKK